MKNLIVCISNNNGMMFNNRRQSRDRLLLEKLCTDYQNERIIIHEYSNKLFDGLNVELSETLCVDGATSFVEDPDLIPAETIFDKIVVVRWNRDYPADKFFTIDLGDYTCVAQEEFVGKSHDEILIETYVYNQN